ncbi:MAG: bifunctional [glutamate--ammonia ligase]-adenylyl-L-tyrosine phosphorylase/[glutamate--ammonia-ligase] adenylyltransferase [Deltaproteobacteria bacterium]|nr:bifunctional [glutamate--ammonia ligase]-adenylyl-L-tyrosine phosphorylase/[glutamate--ammonia-ligase] adenylyltransferase [Deltaproteobacteria bacterium]
MTSSITKLDEKEAEKLLRAAGFGDTAKIFKDLKSLYQTALKDKLDRITELASLSSSPDDCIVNLERIISVSDSAAVEELAKTEKHLERLTTLCGSSEFLSHMLSANPVYLEKLFIENELSIVKDTDIFLSELSVWATAADSHEELGNILRKYRNKEYLRIGSRDLLGLAPMQETAREVSDLASASLEVAVSFTTRKLKETYGTPLCTTEDGSLKEASFCVLGLGKLGGRELNFSSDIDIMYIYTSAEGETAGIGQKDSSRISLHAFFVKLAERVTKLIGEATGEGFVYRVDLDLRPEGKSGELANSLRSLETYYESWGRTWERSAMIKARPVAGDAELGKEFLRMISPFVYRKYLDFAAIEEIKNMKEKIDVHLLRQKPDAVDVKLGKGGIREIEFFCQALQLIHGGKKTEVRENNSLKAIQKLLTAELVTSDEARTLTENYIFLRNLEHRIQIVECKQTQVIPAKTKELSRIARMSGFGKKKTPEQEFWKEYEKRTTEVQSVYKTLFYASTDELVKTASPDALVALNEETPEAEVNSILKKLGFKKTGAVSNSIRILREQGALQKMPARISEILNRIAPHILTNASKTADPDMALMNMERFLSAISGRTSIYAMLAENPPLIAELLKIFGSSAFLSNFITEHPENLDILLSREMSRPIKTALEMQTELSSMLDNAVDYEEELYVLRRFKSQEFFRIGINDTLKTLDDVSGQITLVAETVLEASIKIASREVRKKYGLPGTDSFFVLGMGKLGGGELIYGSDLDIIFIYDNSAGEENTSGPKIISVHEYFAKLAQRIISVLSVRTNAGIVFSIDTRLRPSGSSGPLVILKDALFSYHLDKASIWERQAATKARPVAGNAAFGSDTVEKLRDITYKKGLSNADIDEMLRIRARMETELAKEDNDTFDIKTGKGGLVDIEFLTQALQLKYGNADKGLKAADTLSALRALENSGKLLSDNYKILTEAYWFFRRLETGLRIIHDTSACVLKRGSAETEVLAKKNGYYNDNDAGEKLLGDYVEKTTRVRKIYLDMLNGLKT